MEITLGQIHSAASQARPILNKILAPSGGMYSDMVRARDEVIGRYQMIFSPENIHSLVAEDYRSFLIFSNNKHWKSLQRMGPAHTADMELLRKTLLILLDETQPIKMRLDKVLPLSGPVIPRFGSATITPILMIVYPEKYGVLNNPVEAGLRKLGLWPSFKRETHFSEKYSRVNEILLALAKEFGIDLWTLDVLWWALLLDETKGHEDEIFAKSELTTSEVPPELQRFGLERYFQEFLRDNWEKISEFKDWSLYEQDGDLVGYEYNTNEVGRIDLLAHHKQRPIWLVIELKRNQGSDQTIGQVLRYMGWVAKNLRSANEEVNGLIICNSNDLAIQYALENTKNVDLMLYEVEFQLHKSK